MEATIALTNKGSSNRCVHSLCVHIKMCIKLQLLYVCAFVAFITAIEAFTCPPPRSTAPVADTKKEEEFKKNIALRSVITSFYGSHLLEIGEPCCRLCNITSMVLTA